MSHRRRVRQVLASIVLSGSIVGCSATNGVGDYPCPQNVMEGPQLLYPIPGATGVPDGAGIFVFGGYSPQTLVVLSPPAPKQGPSGRLSLPHQLRCQVRSPLHFRAALKSRMCLTGR